MLQAISLNTKPELLQDDEVVLSRLEQAENDCLGLEHTDTSMLGTSLRPATAPGANPIQRHRLKPTLCRQFKTPSGCRFGDKCAFAHGEAELQPKPTDYV